MRQGNTIFPVNCCSVMCRLLTLILSLPFFCLAVSGCITTEPSAKREELAQMRSTLGEENIKIKDDIYSLQGALDELEYQINTLSEKQDQQAGEINNSINDLRREIKNKLAHAESRLQAVEKKQGQNRKDLENRLNIVIQEVTRENKELRRYIERFRTTVSGTTEEGYYIVANGDTLSHISQVFGVSVKSVMEANGITNPHSIRSGQKLSIPEK